MYDPKKARNRRALHSLLHKLAFGGGDYQLGVSLVNIDVLLADPDSNTTREALSFSNVPKSITLPACGARY